MSLRIDADAIAVVEGDDVVGGGLDQMKEVERELLELGADGGMSGTGDAEVDHGGSVAKIP